MYCILKTGFSLSFFLSNLDEKPTAPIVLKKNFNFYTIKTFLKTFECISCRKCDKKLFLTEHASLSYT